MARFFARFDGAGSPNPGGSYNQRTIAAASASGAPYKVGLLASRSAISDDFLSELESPNRSGGAGIYFPPNLFVNTAGVLTASAYTSSATDATGIRTPADYATRPTASILSTTSHVVGPTNPLDSGSVTYSVYLNGSNAVLATLSAIQPATPYDRLGLNPSRTLHSIFHNPTLDYFAWDDFTPGAPAFSSTSSAAIVYLETTDTLPINISWTPEYNADLSGDITIAAARFVRQSTGEALSTLGTQTIAAANSSYNWAVPGTQAGVSGEGLITFNVQVTGSFADATIPAHVGATTQTSVASVVDVQRVYLLTDVRSGTTMQECCDDLSNSSVYANNTALRNPNSTLLYTDKAGTGVTQGFYAQAGQNVNGGLAVESDGGASVTTVTLECDI